jgi:hypothetical protein
MRRASQRRSAGDDVTTAPNLATAVEFGVNKRPRVTLPPQIGSILDVPIGVGTQRRFTTSAGSARCQ